MNYTLISFDPVTAIAVIQVNGCAVTTEISVPKSANTDTKRTALYDQVAAGVLDAMDPNSRSYDPSLIP